MTVQPRPVEPRAVHGASGRTDREHHAPEGPSVWCRLLDRLRPAPPDPEVLRRQRIARLEDAAVLLEQARAVLERGWVQGTWYALRGSARRTATAALPVAARAGSDEVVGACLVGAVVHAARRVDPGAGPDRWGLPLDLLWDALQGGTGGDAGTRVPSPYVRAARARDLARWNDRPDRTGSDVLRLVDTAVAGAVQGAVRAS